MTALVNPYWYAPTAATDPYFASVVLLCHFDGDYIDRSLAAHAQTGNMPTTTLQQKFGTGSLSAISNGFCSSADSADWNFGAGQFTVECWARRSAAILATGGVFVCHWAGSLAWTFRVSTTNLNFLYSTTGADFPQVTGAYTLPLNTWVHLAADRDAGNVLRLYADGVVIASATVAATFFNGTLDLSFGNDGGSAPGNKAFQGQIDEVRITKGVARYAGAFTPPTAPFPNS